MLSSDRYRPCHCSRYKHGLCGSAAFSNEMVLCFWLMWMPACLLSSLCTPSPVGSSLCTNSPYKKWQWLVYLKRWRNLGNGIIDKDRSCVICFVTAVCPLYQLTHMVWFFWRASGWALAFTLYQEQKSWWQHLFFSNEWCFHGYQRWDGD